MAASIKDREEVKIPETYTLEKADFISEIDSYALSLRHKLSGARVLILSNEDDNKVFSIGFRTPPKDDTGVPHIIEHTVLCGSQNFPAKDPFVELVKGSLNTYLNATTFPDKTLYPVASCNGKDFENLMHVYMDAVFYPNIYQHEEIFQQEGWHYEMDDPDGEITYNGVVYNEMKGAFSSEEGVLERFVMNSLFPDNTYGQESGGDPASIPNLTYEDYIDFHRRYYHPVNSYIYLYGDMDIEERLEWMDEHYLKDFPAIEIDSTIPLQKPFDGMKSLEKDYAVSETADCSEKTYYAYAAAMDVTMDQEVCKAFDMLTYVLAEMPGAPLKQALLNAGIGNDIEVDFCDILRQSYFMLSTKNAEAGKKEQFHQIIRETLEKVVRDGVDRKALEAAINNSEFKEREADFGSFPKGLLYCMRTMKTWLYDDAQPYEVLRYDRYYQFLREQLNTDYYEKLIQKYLLDNPHAVLVEMKPKLGLAAEMERKEKERLAAYKESLSMEERQAVVEKARALKQYQDEPSPKEALEKIPMLSREDIDPNVAPYHNKETVLQGVKTVHHDIHTNDIIYLRMLFDAGDCEEYVPQMSFLSTLLGYMDTKKHSYTEFDTEINFYTGGIAAGTNIFCMHGRPDDYRIQFEVYTKVLRSRVGEALRLMAEMMFETLFTDDKHLKEVVAETRSRLKVRLMSAGHQAAAARAVSYFSKSGWLNDASIGMGYYDYLVQLDENFEQEKERLKKGCALLLRKLLRKEKLLLSCTCDQKGLKAVEDSLAGFLEELDAFAGGEDIGGSGTEEASGTDEASGINGASGTDGASGTLQAYPMDPVPKNEGFLTPAEIQYVAVAGSFVDREPVNYGALRVVRHMLNYGYLWNEVRVKGGAYGVFCQFNRDGEGFFASYRDPKLSETIDVYQKTADYLREYEEEEREILKTIIGTISGMDTPLTPDMKGRRSMMAYLTETPIEVPQKERDEILACGAEDIRAAAGIMDEVSHSGNLCVIGNEQHLQQEREIFGVLKPLS